MQLGKNRIKLGKEQPIVRDPDAYVYTPGDEHKPGPDIILEDEAEEQTAADTWNSIPKGLLIEGSDDADTNNGEQDFVARVGDDVGELGVAAQGSVEQVSPATVSEPPDHVKLFHD